MSYSLLKDSSAGLVSARRAQEPNLPWHQERVSSQDVLLEKMLEMYWDGVHREIVHILLSLIEMQNFTEELAYTSQQGEPSVDDYRPFINQIAQEPDWISYGLIQLERGVHPQRRDVNPQQTKLPRRLGPAPHLETLQAAVSANIQDGNTRETLNYRARCLLRAAGLLDIDKLVEYRDPIDMLGYSSKGRAPQLKIDHFKENGLPAFEPARCRVCQQVLRGIMFRCIHIPCCETLHLNQGDAICEDCFRTRQHPQNHLVKTFKHCILDDSVFSSRSWELCRCTTVARFDSNGDRAVLYPLSPKSEHRITATGEVRCKLFLLPGLVAEAKHLEMERTMKRSKQEGEGAFEKSKSRKVTSVQFHALNAELKDSLERYPDEFPFGNTHISLMIGPLILENGVKNTKSGVIISKRDPINYFVTTDMDDDLVDCIAVNDEREIYTQRRVPRQERRIKACMKQIVGGAFADPIEHALENEIIQDLVTYSKFRIRSMTHKFSQVRRNATLMLPKVKRLLRPRILDVLNRITTRLFDREIALKWDQWSNNCQQFSDKMLPFGEWGALFSGSPSATRPEYLLSFVVRNGSYKTANIKSKYDIPNGVTEEYLYTFKSGRHDDADIIDTMQDYWHDWGAFGGPLYPNQEHLPWDCTEACRPGRKTCNECTVSQHVWSFPFDSWSMLQLSLIKDRRWYAAQDSLSHIDDVQWLRNRIKLFDAQDALFRGAVALARTPKIVLASDWFHSGQPEAFDRIKLGGIHRAQPYSHHLVGGKYLQSYLAPWIHFDHDTRRRIYEAMRDEMVRMKDVPQDNKYYTHDLPGDSWFLPSEDSVYMVGSLLQSYLNPQGNMSNNFAAHFDQVNGGSGGNDGGWGHVIGDFGGNSGGDSGGDSLSNCIVC